jgi:hypothetical protein
MIALVYPVSKVDWTDDIRKFADESLAVAGETDGVEGAMAFRSPRPISLEQHAVSSADRSYAARSSHCARM